MVSGGIGARHIRENSHIWYENGGQHAEGDTTTSYAVVRSTERAEGGLLVEAVTEEDTIMFLPESEVSGSPIRAPSLEVRAKLDWVARTRFHDSIKVDSNFPSVIVPEILLIKVIVTIMALDVRNGARGQRFSLQAAELNETPFASIFTVD